MRYSKLMLVVLGALGMQMAGATPTPEEAAQLGKTLTPMGAIKAGNKEGTIPEWTGGVCTPPAGYKPARGLDEAGGPHVELFPNEKPLFKITAENLAQYADKVDGGSKELFRRFPKTFYMNVYPTHRTACHAQWVYDNTIKNVMRPQIVGGAIPSVTGAKAQVPFPIPKSGVEAIWNVNLVVAPAYNQTNYLTWYVDSSGKTAMIDSDWSKSYSAYWDTSLASLPDDKPYFQQLTNKQFPPSLAGNAMMFHRFLRQDLKGDPVWSYIPGQRRVRLAPEFAYDGVAPSAGGTLLYDEANGFSGKMDRFDFKLLGRKEYYIAYNSSDELLSKKEVATPNHLSPEAVRYELHRVWVVEATIRPGERHVSKTKTFLIDEDSWSYAAFWATDNAGKIGHMDFWNLIQAPELPYMQYSSYQSYDLTKGAYAHWLMMPAVGENGFKVFGRAKAMPLKSSLFVPEAMSGSGVR